MTIAKFLDLSTKYMLEHDAVLLQDEDADSGPLIVRRHEYGWFVHIPSDATELKELTEALKECGFSDAFINLIKYASAHECWWINFDQDGEDEYGLPTFDW